MVPNDTKNTLKIQINQNTNSKNDTYSTEYSGTKSIWHIPVNSNEFGVTINDSISTTNISNITQPSNVTTMERINDLELVETKLNSLKSQFETSL